MLYVVMSYVAAFVGGAVVWHFYATKVLGYAKSVVGQVQAKL